MKYKDLREFLTVLDNAGLLKRIKAEVDLKYELGAIASMSLSAQGPALMFENVKGYTGLPMVANIMSTPKMVELAFECPYDKLPDKILEGMQNPVQPRVVNQGPCKEEIHDIAKTDLDEFPTPLWHELDGGRYMGTQGGCISKNPESGSLNMGTYRLMIKGKNLLSMSTHAGEVCEYIKINEERNLSTPLAVAFGMDPLLTFASGAPIPSNIRNSEFAAVGGWRREPVELIKCETNDLLVPANAEIILEGEILPKERVKEGPHGESHGFYGQDDVAYLFKVNCITHRKHPVSYGLICGKFDDSWARILVRAGTIRSKLSERGLKGIKKVHLPSVGAAHSCCIIAADVQDPSDTRTMMDTLWKNRLARWVIVVDADADVYDWNDVMWRISNAVRADKDVVLGPKFGGHEPLAHLMGGGYSGLGIDATMRFKGGEFPPINKVSPQLKQKEAQRWEELGLKDVPLPNIS